MNSGILYNYLDSNSFDKENLIVNYSFEEINDSVVFNEIYTNDLHYPSAGCLDASVYPGIPISCVSNPEFESFKGCCSMGYFDSQTVLRIGNTFDSTSWSIFVNYNNNVIRNDRDKAEVILSSMESPTGISGFNLGINGSNRLYFEYISSDGILKNIVLPKEVELYNLISVSKSPNVISISNHDPFSRKDYNVDYYMDDFADSNVWTLGGFYNTGSFERYRGFRGFVDDFLLFDAEYTVAQRNLVSEALYFTGIKDAYEKETVKTIETITGAPTIISTPTSSGITGYEMEAIPGINTVCNTPVTVCNKTALYGDGYEDVLDFERVNIDVTEIELIPEEKLYNEVYTSNYGEKNIVFLKDIDVKDIYEIYSQSGYDPNLNKSYAFDVGYSSFIISDTDAGKNLNVFINGVHALPGDGYSISDFYISSGTGYIFESTDTLIYDVIDSPVISYAYDGIDYPEIILTGEMWLDKDVYFRGQKLLSGQDYIEFFEYGEDGSTMTQSGIEIYPKEESNDKGITGSYAFVNHGDLRSVVYTGTVDAFDSLSFNLRNEQIWLNGYRQIENVDYIKTSDKSLLNGDIRLESKSHLIYNNSEDFWNGETMQPVTTTTTTAAPGGGATTTTTTMAPGY